MRWVPPSSGSTTGVGRVRSRGRGGDHPPREIVIGMNEMIETVLTTAGWIAGVSVLLVMALLPLLERLGGAR